MTLAGAEAREGAILFCYSAPHLACHPLPCGPRWLKTTRAFQPAGRGKRNAFSFHWGQVWKQHRANPISSHFWNHSAGKCSVLPGNRVSSHKACISRKDGELKSQVGGPQTVLIAKTEGHKGSMISVPIELTYPNNSPITALPWSAKPGKREETRRQGVTQVH